MKHLLSTAAIGSGLLMAGHHAMAADAANKAWEGESELGIVTTSGNTDTQTINVKGKIINNSEQWRHTGKLDGLKTSSDNETTARRIQLSAKSDYKTSEFNYFFGTVVYDDDRFSGYDYRVSEAIGYGRRVIHQENLTLDLEIGPGARQSKLDNGDSESEFIVRAAAGLDWKISDTATFTQDLNIDAGEESTITKSVTALKSQIAGSLAMKVSYTIKNTSDVPPGVKKTDTETALTLVYSY
ncbi:MAG: DUF481 domain-containing protein [Gammaproteobacteria bacterium]|nr:DUF481 domain-containing protein [Gammaproteobacteria bacterium]